MLQSQSPEDYVVATGELHSVREFVDAAFSAVGLDYRNHVRTDPQFFRPTEAVPLRGDPRKAEERLNWSRSVAFQEIVRIMVAGELSLHGNRS